LFDIAGPGGRRTPFASAIIRASSTGCPDTVGGGEGARRPRREKMPITGRQIGAAGADASATQEPGRGGWWQEEGGIMRNRVEVKAIWRPQCSARDVDAVGSAAAQPGAGSWRGRPRTEGVPTERVRAHSACEFCRSWRRGHRRPGGRGRRHGVCVDRGNFYRALSRVESWWRDNARECLVSPVGLGPAGLPARGWPGPRRALGREPTTRLGVHLALRFAIIIRRVRGAEK